VRPGGLDALDTPNVARYWNRRALERGETILQPIEDRYLSDAPWEGPHREYTAGELGWMLEQVGCEDLGVEFLDHNMLQFEELSGEDAEYLATTFEDPSQSDMLLPPGDARSRRVLSRLRLPRRKRPETESQPSSVVAQPQVEGARRVLEAELENRAARLVLR
jgi:hypothetical protein